MQAYQHPVFPDIRVRVDDDEAGARWRAQGWKRVSKDKAPEQREEPSTVVLGATAGDTPPGGLPVD